MTDPLDPLKSSVILGADIVRSITVEKEITHVEEKKPKIAKALRDVSDDARQHIDRVFSNEGGNIGALRVVEDEMRAASYILMVDSALKKQDTSEADRLARLLMRQTDA